MKNQETEIGPKIDLYRISCIFPILPYGLPVILTKDYMQYSQALTPLEPKGWTLAHVHPWLGLRSSRERWPAPAPARPPGRSPAKCSKTPGKSEQKKQVGKNRTHIKHLGVDMPYGPPKKQPDIRQKI